MFFEQMHPDWQGYLAEQRSFLSNLEDQLLKMPGFIPSAELVMRAFERDPKQIKVVILGQDPYPNPMHAVGLAFAVPVGQAKPQSLKNILRELSSDMNISISKEADIAKWADKGVLLLNTALTTMEHRPGAHAGLGWASFTENALRKLTERQPLVLLAWGNHAKSIARNLKVAKVIESAHPSPLSASRGFFGSKPFSRTNQALIEMGLEPIDWKL